MTISVVKNLLIKAAQTKQGSEAMHFTQAAINAAQALNLAQMTDDLFSEPMAGQNASRGYGSAIAASDVSAARSELSDRGIDPYWPRTGLGSATAR